MVFGAGKVVFLSGITLLLGFQLFSVADEKQEQKADDSNIEIMRHLLNAWSIRTKQNRSNLFKSRSCSIRIQDIK